MSKHLVGVFDAEHAPHWMVIDDYENTSDFRNAQGTALTVFRVIPIEQAAAAPELLEALRAAFDVEANPDDMRPWAIAARAAIAKAEGK